MFELPKDWIWKTISRVALPGKYGFDDGDWIESPYITDKGIRLVQTGNIGIGEFIDKEDSKKFISEETFNSLKCKWVYPNDILICRLAEPIGRACEIPDHVGNCITAVDCTIYRPDPSKADRHFALHWLNSHLNLKAVLDVAGGSTRQRISRGNLGSLPIPIPPLPEQIQIARILDTIDEGIRKTEQLIDKLKAMKQGLLHDLLTRGIDENGQLRDPIRHPDLFKDSPLGRIPKEWQIRELGEMADLVTSGSRGWARYYADIGSLFIRSQNVRMGYLDFFDSQHVVPPSSTEGQRTRIYPLDLLITITGNNVGNVAYIPENWSEEAFVSQHVGLVRLNEPLVTPLVMYYLVRGSPGNQQLTDAQYGQSKPGLNLDNLKALQIPIPPKNERSEIIDQLSRSQERIQREEESIEKLRILKQGLMTDLLTGRVRVTDLPEATP